MERSWSTAHWIPLRSLCPGRMERLLPLNRTLAKGSPRSQFFVGITWNHLLIFFSRCRNLPSSDFNHVQLHPEAPPRSLWTTPLRPWIEKCPSPWRIHQVRVSSRMRFTMATLVTCIVWSWNILKLWKTHEKLTNCGQDLGSCLGTANPKVCSWHAKLVSYGEDNSMQ